MGRKKDKSKRKTLLYSKNNSVAPKQESIKTSNENVDLLNQSINSPIDIISRLEFPFIEPSENDAIFENEKENFEFNFRPRMVFACNLCLTCMQICNGSATCENCGLVSYCSINHREQDQQEHKNLCNILTDVCSTNKGLNLAKDLSPDDYRTFRVKLIEIIEQGLKRNLDLWEKEVLLYPRLCRKCHRKEDLSCCLKCKMDFYCSEEHRGDHDQWCDQFQVFRRILFLQKYHGSVVPKLPNRKYKESHPLPQNLDQLLSDIFGPSEYYKKMDCHTYASLSYMATVPLSTLFALQKCCDDWRTKNNITLHIIGAEFQFECWNLRAWEKLFLHYLPNLLTLTLIFTGPELQIPQVLVKILQKVKTCSQCTASSRRINVIFNQGKLFHDIKESKDPDLVCLFNPGLYRKTGFNGNDTWPLTIRKFCGLKVPVVITAYTEKEIPQDIEAIKSVCDINLIMEPQKNPFAALKPDRNFVSDDKVPLMYKNNFISVIRGIS